MPATPQPHSGPLPEAARPGLEAALGGSLDGVRVATHDALGFGGGATVGRVVHLGPTATRATLAHELAHVVQQRALGARLPQGQDGTVAGASAAPPAIAAGPLLQPVSLYLAPELRLPQPPLFGDALLPLLVLDESSPVAVMAVVAREALSRFMAAYVGPATLVGVAGRAPEMSLTFVLEPREVVSPDGLLHLEHLQALVPEGALERELEGALEDAYRLVPAASRFVAARHAVSGMRSLVDRIGGVPARYSLDEISELRTELAQTSRDLIGDQPPLTGPAWRAQLSTAARQVDAVLPLLDGALTGLRAHHARTAKQQTSVERVDALSEAQRSGLQKGSAWEIYSAMKAGELAGQMALGQVVGNVLSGGAVTDMDRVILDYRGGHVSYAQYRELSRQIAWRAAIAVTLSVAAGFLGGGAVGAIGGRAFMATLGGRVLAGAVGGAAGAAGLLGGQDVYSGIASRSTDDALVRARFQAQIHSGRDYAVGIGSGALFGGALGAGSYLLGPRPRRPPKSAAAGGT